MGSDGLRKFIMLPIWTVNDFIFSIKEIHFKTLRGKYQIPNNIPLCLPYKLEKCYYDSIEGVGVYEQMLKVGLRFPLSSLHHQFLQHLGLSVNQISPNTWRVFLGVEVLYGAMSDGARRLTAQEFLHCYCPNEISQSKGMYNFVPKSPLLRLVCETPNSNRNWKSWYFFMEGDGWMSRLGDNEFIPVDVHEIYTIKYSHIYIFSLTLCCFVTDYILSLCRR